MSPPKTAADLLCELVDYTRDEDGGFEGEPFGGSMADAANWILEFVDDEVKPWLERESQPANPDNLVVRFVPGPYPRFEVTAADLAGLDRVQAPASTPSSSGWAIQFPLPASVDRPAAPAYVAHARGFTMYDWTSGALSQDTMTFDTEAEATAWRDEHVLDGSVTVLVDLACRPPASPTPPTEPAPPPAAADPDERTRLRVVRTSTEPYQSDEKRFYVPGVALFSPCPSCGKEEKFDLDNNYLSYPILGGDEEVTFYCNACDEKGLSSNWTESIVVRISIEPGTPPKARKGPSKQGA